MFLTSALAILSILATRGNANYNVGYTPNLNLNPLYDSSNGPISDVENLSAYALDDQIKEALNRLKEKFPRGIPELGLPVLDPYHKDVANFGKKITGILKVSGQLRDMEITGLRNVQIHNASLQIVGLHFNFDFGIPQIIINGQYKVKGKALVIIPFSSSGGFRAELNDIRIVGSTKISVRKEDKTLFLEYLKISITNGKVKVDLHPKFGGAVMRKVMNAVMKKLTPNVVDLERRKMETELSQKIIKLADDELKNYTLKTLLEKISAIKQF